MHGLQIRMGRQSVMDSRENEQGQDDDESRTSRTGTDPGCCDEEQCCGAGRRGELHWEFSRPPAESSHDQSQQRQEECSLPLALQPTLRNFPSSGPSGTATASFGPAAKPGSFGPRRLHHPTGRTAGEKRLSRVIQRSRQLSQNLSIWGTRASAMAKTGQWQRLEASVIPPAALSPSALPLVPLPAPRTETEPVERSRRSKPLDRLRVLDFSPGSR